MSKYKKIDQDNIEEITAALEGHRIVDVKIGAGVTPPTLVETEYSWDTKFAGSGEYGVLVLDNGQKVYLIGNDGGCSCSGGCYDLKSLAKVDNIITKVETAQEEPDYSGRHFSEGHWRLFVYCEDERFQVADFEGDDGSGYYGTGFHLAVTLTEPS